MRARWKLTLGLLATVIMAAVGIFLIVDHLTTHPTPLVAQGPPEGPISVDEWFNANAQAAARIRNKPAFRGTLSGITFTQDDSDVVQARARVVGCQSAAALVYAPLEHASQYGLDVDSLKPTYLPEGATFSGGTMTVCPLDNKVTDVRLAYRFPESIPYFILIGWRPISVVITEHPQDELQAGQLVAGKPAVLSTAFDNTVYILLNDGSVLTVGGFGQFPLAEILKVAESIPKVGQ